MSTPCSKPLQYKSSPEDEQNLAEVWAVSSFSSPWFLSSLSESQLKCSWDLLETRAEFYQYQEESNSLRPHTSWALLTVTLRWQWPSQEPGISSWFLMTSPWSNLTEQSGRWEENSDPSQTVATERMDLRGDLWSTLSAETLPRVLSLSAQACNHLHRYLRWITKGRTGWHDSIFPVWKWMSILFRTDIILFSMCFPFIPALTLRLYIAGRCRGKGRREKEPELSLIKILWAFKVRALGMNQCGCSYVRAQGRLWRTHGLNNTTHLFLEIKFRCFWEHLLRQDEVKQR